MILSDDGDDENAPLVTPHITEAPSSNNNNSHERLTFLWMLVCSLASVLVLTYFHYVWIGSLHSYFFFATNATAVLGVICWVYLHENVDVMMHACFALYIGAAVNFCFVSCTLVVIAMVVPVDPSINVSLSWKLCLVFILAFGVFTLPVELSKFAAVLR